MNRPSPFGKYILLERISVGGMAEVFKGRTFGVEGFARYVAIKRILPQLAEDSRFVEMFIDEAKMAAQLNHANIVQVIELGREQNDHFIAMEYVAGKDLLALFHNLRKTKKRLAVHLAAFVGHQVAEGLDYAHRKRGSDGRPLGIVHRDVSPQNVLVSYDGAVKLIDFGIAKARKQSYEATKAGVLKGKFGYMSPELIEARPVDPRSDLFSLGVVLWELITAERLFTGDNEFITLEKVRLAEVDPPSTRNPEVPPELDRILLRALARDPEDRYQSTAELADDLARYLHSQGFSHSTKDLGIWMRSEFAADFAEERRKAQIHARITLTSDGKVVEAQDDEEPTALWQPDSEMAEDWARAVAAPDEIEAPPDPLAALASARAPLANRPTEPRPSPQPGLKRPTDSLPISERATDLRATVASVPRKRLPIALITLLVVGILALAAGTWWLLKRPEGPPGEGQPQGNNQAGAAGPESNRHADLRFEVTPEEATITVDQVPVKGGEIRVSPGRAVQVRVESPGHLPFETTLVPQSGRQILRYALQAQPGSLFIESRPRGTLFLDGQRQGPTPRSVGELDPKRPWKVRIEAPGHSPFEQTIVFGADRFRRIDAELVPLK